jgi:hypothetical protein
MIGASGDMYPAYAAKVAQRMAVSTPFDADFTFVHNGDGNYTATIDVSKVGDYTDDVQLYVFITESNIELSSSWGGLTTIHYVNRQMVPDQNGIALDFSGGNDIVEEINFDLDPALDPDDCEIVIAIQNNTTKEIFNGAMIPMLQPDFENDAILTDILFPTEAACDGQLSPRVNIKNYGSLPLTSLDIEYTINGGETAVYNWTGDLGFTQTEIVVLPALDYTGETTNTLEVALTNPNGVDDGNPDNNSASTEFETAPETTTHLSMQLFVGTSMAFQISWKMIGPDGEIVDEGSGYSNNTLVEVDFPLIGNGCYDFFLYDSGGNGFVGGGYLKMYDGDDLLIYISDELEDVYNFTFHTMSGVGFDEITDQGINIYPNPAMTNTNVTYSLDQKSDVQVEIYSISGALVFESPVTSQNIGEQSFQINTTSLEEGVYFVNLKINENIITKKITVIK